MSTAFGSKTNLGLKKRRYLTMTHEHAMDVEPDTTNGASCTKTAKRTGVNGAGAGDGGGGGDGVEGGGGDDDDDEMDSISSIDSAASRSSTSSILHALFNRGNTTGGDGGGDHGECQPAAATIARIKRGARGLPARRQCAVLRAYKTDQWFRRPNFATKDCLCLFLSGHTERRRGYRAAFQRESVGAATAAEVAQAASLPLGAPSPAAAGAVGGGDGSSGGIGWMPWRHVDVGVGPQFPPPRFSNMVPTTHTSPWRECNGSAPVGSTTDPTSPPQAPLYMDDEVKATRAPVRTTQR